MRRLRVVPFAIAVGLLTCVAAHAERPNIILFLTDDQRFDQLRCAGHPVLETPAIDALAAGGVRFTKAFVTTSICAASRASIFTGIEERAHGFTFGTPPLSSELCAKSYPAVLRDNGYRTGFVGKLGVKLETPARELFDSFRPLGQPYRREKRHGGRHLTDITGDLAIEFIRQRRGPGPFCLSVSFNAPHAQDHDKVDHYPTPDGLEGLYEKAPVPPPRYADRFSAHPKFLRESLNRKRWYWRWDTPEKYERNMRAYWRMITGIDRTVARVIAELERLDLAETTVVIFTSDNGYYLGDRGFAGKWSHYEESLRVPLIIQDPRLPDARRGRTVAAPALNTDITATILALAGVNDEAGRSGKSLLPWTRGEEPTWREDFYCEHRFDHDAIPKWEGVRGKRWVYAHYFEERYEYLHDLAADPGQLRNLADDEAHAETLAKLRRRCEELRPAPIPR